MHKDEPLNQDEYVVLGLECAAVRNRYNNRSGFSPMQRVFVTTTRLPASISSDDPIDPSYMYQDLLADYKRAEELRQAAARVWAALDSRSKLLRSLRGRHRTPQNFVDGQLVFVWRQGKVGDGKWHGPGVIVLNIAGGAWVNMRGSLWRVAHEQMRGATQEESLGAEIVNKYLVTCKDSWGKKICKRRSGRTSATPRRPSNRRGRR